MARILYVDDERAIGRAVHAWLSRQGVEVSQAHSVRGARSCLARHRYDGAFIDVWLGDGTGFELYDEIRAQHPELAARVAFVTGDTVPRAEIAKRMQAIGCPVLTKPFDLSELETWVEVWRASAARESRADGGEDDAAPRGGRPDRDRSPPAP